MAKEPERFVIDLDQLTLGDLEELEERTGIRVLQGLDLARMPVSAIPVLLWLVKRKDDPSYTLDDARSIQFGDLPEIEVTGGDDDTDAATRPTDAGGSAAKSRDGGTSA